MEKLIFGPPETPPYEFFFQNSAIAIDILGPYRYQTGNVTRANRPKKAWILICVCHQTSAITFECMAANSTDSLLEALQNHALNTRAPRVISSDAGSQIKAAARMATRASVKIAESLNKTVVAEKE